MKLIKAMMFCLVWLLLSLAAFSCRYPGKVLCLDFSGNLIEFNLANRFKKKVMTDLVSFAVSSDQKILTFVKGGKIFSAKIDGSEARLIYEAGPMQEVAGVYMVDEAERYYLIFYRTAGDESQTVHRVLLDAQSKATREFAAEDRPISLPNHPTHVAYVKGGQDFMEVLKGGMIAYSDKDPEGIYLLKLDGFTEEKVAPHGAYLCNLTDDQEKIYYYDAKDKAIKVYDTRRRELKTLKNVKEHLRWLNAYGEYVYFSQGNHAYRMDQNGETVDLGEGDLIQGTIHPSSRLIRIRWPTYSYYYQLIDWNASPELRKIAVIDLDGNVIWEKHVQDPFPIPAEGLHALLIQPMETEGQSNVIYAVDVDSKEEINVGRFINCNWIENRGQLKDKAINAIYVGIGLFILVGIGLYLEWRRHTVKKRMKSLDHEEDSG